MKTQRNSKCIVLIWILGLSVVMMPACSKDKTKPTRLFGTLYSYQTPEQVRDELKVKPGAWEIVEQSQLLKTDTRPPFNILSVTVRNHKHHGFRGDLLLYFFNERLMQTSFYTEDVQSYKTTLTSDGVSINDEQEGRIQPATRVWVGKDAEGRWYVGWIDLQLRREHGEWIKKYS